jgi:hypothetical protein
MYLPIPTWLVFAFLTVAAFAPVAGRWPGWWVVYYGALLVCWVLVSIAALRRAGRADRMRQRKLARLFRQHRNAEKARLEEAGATAVPRALAPMNRLIIVVQDRRAELQIRRRTVGDDDALVITDRRRADRRQRMDGYVAERRLAERRRHDIRALLVTQGWAEVLTSEGNQPTP